jgi:hypothetical protein
MSTIHRIHRSHRLVVGSALVLACTLLVPVVGSAQEEEVAVPAPLAAPAAVGTSAASVRAVAQALAAEQALHSGDIGSLQEDRLLAIIAAAQEEAVAVPAPLAAPAVVSTSSDDVRAARAFAAEQALRSGDIGSMQEEHFLAIIAAAASWDETSGYGALEASRAAIASTIAK